MQKPIINNKKFGIQMGAALFALALFGFVRGWPQPALFVLIGLAVLHLVLAFVAPTLLGRINSFWMGIGFLLGKIVQPIVMTILYFVLFTPIALIMRVIGRDELLLKKRSAETFWKLRANPKITADSFKYQY